MRSSKTGRKTSSAASFVWQVALSCWNQWLHKHCPLKRQLIVQRWQIAAFEEAKQRLIMKSSKTGLKTTSVALAVCHVAPSCWNQMLSIFSSSIPVNNNSLNLITIATPCYFSTNYASRSKSALNSDSFGVCRFFNVCVRVFCALNSTILLVYISAKIKMSFIWKDDFF